MIVEPPTKSRRGPDMYSLFHALIVRLYREYAPSPTYESLRVDDLDQSRLLTKVGHGEGAEDYEAQNTRTDDDSSEREYCNLKLALNLTESCPM